MNWECAKNRRIINKGNWIQIAAKKITKIQKEEMMMTKEERREVIPPPPRTRSKHLVLAAKRRCRPMAFESSVPPKHHSTTTCSQGIKHAHTRPGQVGWENDSNEAWCKRGNQSERAREREREREGFEYYCGFLGFDWWKGRGRKRWALVGFWES